ncbi:H-2 class II histocompatibility antigen, A-Q alpha chain [Austrofundulus limnaeus]|uniref:H-2 class II histocompatibility antigen, A-Q alpha chain n=1 Tax=Austrofundulus limnaeus TaxID=52670 RepID=A0A2I4BRN5_AUSLI|nr:PREDICTED: H-2 class II histocompatibility antigen, A-Q alpha chain-like [Austrofundulus limnaeus]
MINAEENTLICFVYDFFPPVINIRWSKNDEEVMMEAPFIKTVSNSEGVFHVFSYLNFVPQEGDTYSCTVEHEALDEPKTRILVVETNEKSRGPAGPAVCCGLGLILGLLGVAAGTFFFVKGKQCHDAVNIAWI